MWAAGERERYEEFFRLRGQRMENRARLERALMAPSLLPYMALQDNFAALIFDAEQRRLPPEGDFPDSRVVVNQNLW